MRSIHGLGLSLVFLTVYGSVAGCSSCSASNDTSAFGGGGSGGGTGAGTTTGTGATGGGISLGGFGGGTPTTFGCSPDLTKVVDGDGNVIEECPPDQGCSAGECVPACQAAADSKGNVGCDFVVATPHFYVGITPPCFAVFVANNWPKEAKLSIERGGVPYDVTQFGRIPNQDPTPANWPAVPATGVPPGEVAVLFLSQDPSSYNAGPLTCPVPPAVSVGGGTAVQSTGRGQAWHVTSDVPISAYDILPFGGASSYLPSAELLLPTSAWGDNYVAVLPKDSSGPPWGQLVAMADNTKIDVLPSTPLPAGTNVDAAPQNQTTSFMLNAGEYIQWQLTVEMTGSILKSDKPVAFTGGNGYICYTSATSQGGGCDSAHQQIPPVAALGFEYVAPPYNRRLDGQYESIPYRIVGAVDGTTLTYDPPVAGAPPSVGVGQKFDFEASGPFRVTSQDKDHPFYVGQLMTGCFVTGGDSSSGDEEYVNILPPAQFLSKYVFFTDPTYPTTQLVFVRSKLKDQFYDVNLECLGNVSGWTPVGGNGQYEVALVEIIKNGAGNGACTNGPQVAESEGPFGVMVWGLSTYASYAYPAGGSVAPINTVVVPPTPK